MKYLLPCLIAILLVQRFSCTLGIDVSQLFSVANFTCMKNSGITFGIARGYCSFGGVDQHVIQSLTNMKEAGLQASTYMFPCRGKDPIAQVNEMLDHIPANLYKNIWIDVETNPSPGCSWSGHNSTSNCQFLTAIIKELKTKGKSVGIYASKYMWSTIFGSVGFCPQAAEGGIPLWYAHYDNVPSFEDFQPFAGWTKPAIKQYAGTTSFCGASVDRSWAP